MSAALPKSGTARLFVALEIGAAVRQALAAEQAVLRKTHPKLQWVPPGNIHLTLAFLGDVPVERGPEIVKALNAAGAGLERFSASVEGLGTFGRPQAPRVIWAGLGQGAEDVCRLQARVAEALRTVGFPGETRPFSAHLTLGRVKFTHTALGLTRVLQRRGQPVFGSMPVDAVLLMRSELLPQGPVYTVVNQCP